MNTCPHGLADGAKHPLRRVFDRRGVGERFDDGVLRAEMLFGVALLGEIAVEGVCARRLIVHAGERHDRHLDFHERAVLAAAPRHGSGRVAAKPVLAQPIGFF